MCEVYHHEGTSTLYSRVSFPLADGLVRYYVAAIVSRRGVKVKAELIAQADIQPGQNILDVGCGTGTLILMIKQAHPDAVVYGLDVDPQILAIARSNLLIRFTIDFDIYAGHWL